MVIGPGICQRAEEAAQGSKLGCGRRGAGTRGLVPFKAPKCPSALYRGSKQETCPDTASPCYRLTSLKVLEAAELCKGEVVAQLSQGYLGALRAGRGWYFLV